MRRRVRSFEAAHIASALRRLRMERATAWPPVLDEIIRDLEGRSVQTAQSDVLILDVRSARPDDDAMATVSISEAARNLNVHRQTLARMVASGGIPSVVVGKRRRIRTADLDRLTAKATEVS